jgi:hypothetical protein
MPYSLAALFIVLSVVLAQAQTGKLMRTVGLGAT